MVHLPCEGLQSYSKSKTARYTPRQWPRQQLNLPYLRVRFSGKYVTTADKVDDRRMDYTEASSSSRVLGNVRK